MRRTELAIAILMFVVTGDAAAALTLPGLRVPNPVTVPSPVDAIINEVHANALQRLAERRELRLKTLVRRHRDVLEADANGEPIVRGELLALEPAPDVLARARAEGFSVLREAMLDALGMKLVVLKAPPEKPTQHGLERFGALDSGGTYDLNHVFERMGEAEVLQEVPGEGADTPKESVEGDPVRIGLIDGGVATGNAALRGIHIEQTGCDGAPVPSDHGTAVAFLLAEQDPHATATSLYAVDVYCGKPT